MAESSKDCDCQPFSVLVANEYMLKINETMGNMIKGIVKKDKEYFKNNIKEALLDEIVEVLNNNNDLLMTNMKAIKVLHNYVDEKDEEISGLEKKNRELNQGISVLNKNYGKMCKISSDTLVQKDVQIEVLKKEVNSLKQNNKVELKALSNEVTVKDRLIKVLRSKNLKLNRNVKKMEQNLETKRLEILNQKLEHQRKKVSENDTNFALKETVDIPVKTSDYYPVSDFVDFYDCERASLEIEIKERTLRLDLESLMTDLAVFTKRF